MTATAYETIREALTTHGSQVTERGAGDAMAQCPAHEDRRPSLHVQIGRTGDRAVLHCFAGCTDTDVLAALGLGTRDLFDNEATYEYVDGARVHRGAGKSFTQSGNRKGRSLFRVEHLPNDMSAPVLVVEGEKDANSAAYLDPAVYAVSPRQGSGTGPERFDWAPLKGRPVVIVADSDDAGLRHAHRVADLLENVAESVRIVRAAEGKDFTDHVMNGHAVDELVPVDEAAEPGASGVKGPESTSEKRSAAALLVDLATERYDFGCTVEGEAFAVPRDGDRHIVRMLRGGRASLRAELAKVYRRETGRVAGQQALADAMLTLEGEAQETDPRQLHLRVARTGSGVWIDLGDAAGSAVRITAAGWTVTDRDVPVLFRRTALTGALPVPQPGGHIDELWQRLNVAAEDRPLVLAWLVAALGWPDIPHPVLALMGEQGTGKSSACRALVGLVDPSPVPLRKPPKDAEGWVTAASSSWAVGLDNMSTVPDWLSDTLCRAVTGDGDVRRQLYTDAGVVAFAFRRVIVLNGIDVGAVNSDLADRTILVTLDRIADSRRRTEADLNSGWDAARARLFGVLCAEIAGIAGMVSDLRLTTVPRMADFARVLAALDQRHGTDGLIRYSDQATAMAEDVIAGNSFLSALAAMPTEISGTAAEIRDAVSPTEDGWRPPRDWPKSARAVTSTLKRNAPALRRAGWTVDDLGRGGRSKVARWRLAPPEKVRETRLSRAIEFCPGAVVRPAR